MEEPPPVPNKDAKPARAAEPTYVFDMRDKPWSKVFEWLADITGKPVLPGISMPTGTFSFINPKGQKFTIPEIIDIINDTLQSHPSVAEGDQSLSARPSGAEFPHHPDRRKTQA
jgi:hypothetical protein